LFLYSLSLRKDVVKKTKTKFIKKTTKQTTKSTKSKQHKTTKKIYGNCEEQISKNRENIGAFEKQLEKFKELLFQIPQNLETRDRENVLKKLAEWKIQIGEMQNSLHNTLEKEL